MIMNFLWALIAFPYFFFFKALQCMCVCVCFCARIIWFWLNIIQWNRLSRSKRVRTHTFIMFIFDILFSFRLRFVWFFSIFDTHWRQAWNWVRLERNSESCENNQRPINGFKWKRTVNFVTLISLLCSPHMHNTRTHTHTACVDLRLRFDLK